MAKKPHNIIETKKKTETKQAGTGKYTGAEWTGPEGLTTPEFGKLIKGQIYSIDETRAKNSNDWRPVYESKN